MASAKAPFGTMHNQPQAKPRKTPEIAPWDKDSSFMGRTLSPAAPPKASAVDKEKAAAASRKASKVSCDKEQVAPPSNSSRVSRPSCDLQPPASFRNATPRNVAGSTRTAPFGTAHNVPVQGNRSTTVSKAPWERDDSQQFQKIAFGNLKSFGAFIRS